MAGYTLTVCYAAVAAPETPYVSENELLAQCAYHNEYFLSIVERVHFYPDSVKPDRLNTIWISANLVPTPPGDHEFASAEPADDSPADVTPMESQPLFSSTESEPLGFSVLQDPKPQHSKSRFGLIRCSICCLEIQRRCLRP